MKNKYNFFVKKYILFVVIVIFFIPLMLIFITYLFYDVFANKILFTSITSNAFLSYLGSIYAGIATAFVSFLSIYETKKANEYKSKLEYEKRKTNIRPVISINIERKEENRYVLCIENINKQIIRGLYLYDCELKNIIKSENIKCDFVVDELCNNEKYYIDKKNFEFNEKGLPIEIELYYEDIDGNLLINIFKLNENGNYELVNNEYIDEKCGY